MPARLRAHEESFRASDGVELRYTVRARGGRPLVLVVPGIFVHRTSAPHTLLAERLAERFDVATLDVRGHGDSGGAFTWGRREPEDVAELVASLRTRWRRVGAVGFSFGGFHVALAAALHRSFDAVATVGAPQRLFVLDHNFLGGDGLRRTLALALQRERRRTRLSPLPPSRRAGPGRLVDRIAPVPLLVAHGRADWLIAPAHAEEMYRRARDPKELLMIDGGLHAEYMLEADPEPLVDGLLGFLGRTLR